MDLVPIKLTIRKNPQGGALFPDLNTLQSDLRQNLGWSKFVDVHGSGLKYDKVDNLGTGADTGAALVLVPKDFADAAVAAFPNDVEKLTELEAETFYNDRYAVQLQENFVNEEALKIYIVKSDLGVALSAKEQADLTKALDPADPKPGVVANPNKTWSTFLAKKNINIVQ